MEQQAKKLMIPRRVDQIARRSQLLFALLISASILSFILWSANTQLDTVTRGSGRIVPFSQNQTVQHLEGGIVRKILVREGQTVSHGEVMVIVEDQFSSAEMEQTRLELQSLEIKQRRLLAEATGTDNFTPTDESEKQSNFYLTELDVYLKRNAQQRERVGILEDQIRQRELELGELKKRQENLGVELALISEQEESLQKLVKIGAVSRNELLDARATMQKVKTRLADLEYKIPQTEAALSEVAKRRSEAILDFRATAETERSEVMLQIAKLRERTAALNDRDLRSEVRAPLSGVVNKLLVTTVGGVVRPGQPIAEIVPSGNSIAVEVRLQPNDRSKVWPGLPAIVKISAYEYARYGGLQGKVTEISPDTLTDQNGRSYFRVRLEADGSTLAEGRPVVPGMLADVDILTAKHTVLDYLIRPVLRLQDNALRQ